MNEYFDIIDLPHHQSKRHAHMSSSGRAAQFAPFAALSGYDEQVAEEARLTAERTLLDEETEERLNEELSRVSLNINERPQVLVTYFLPDSRKSGGEYITVSKRVRRVDECMRELIFTDGSSVSADDISDLRLIT